MVRRLAIDEWSPQDRNAWLDACQPNVRLKRGGRAADLAEATRTDLEGRFGSFVGFLDQTGRHYCNRSALEFLEPGIVEEYVCELQTSVSSVTVHGMIYKLRRMAEILRPGINTRWLKEIELELVDLKRPAPKGPRVVNSDKIFDAGVRLIGKAEAAIFRTDLQRACMVRNGLLIAFLAVCPIRLKNLAALTIGETIIHEGDEWWLRLPDTDTKSKRLDHRVIPDMLARWIDLYVETYKPAFPKAETVMWPSQYGGPMSKAGVYRLVVTTTERMLRKAISPHMFRHCAPYTIANIDGSRINLASSLLQHSDPRITQKHYNLAQSVESSRAFGDIVSGLMKDDLKTDENRKVRP